MSRTSGITEHGRPHRLMAVWSATHGNGWQTSVVENPDGTYVARVFAQRTNFLIAAAFHNVNPEPTSGPTNVVQMGILTADGINRVGLSTDAVVAVTGPGDE